MLHLLDGAVQEHKDILLKMEEEKSPAPGGIWTHNLLIIRRVFYRCATIVALDQVRIALASVYVCCKN